MCQNAVSSLLRDTGSTLWAAILKDVPKRQMRSEERGERRLVWRRYNRGNTSAGFAEVFSLTDTPPCDVSAAGCKASAAHLCEIKTSWRKRKCLSVISNFLGVIVLSIFTFNTKQPMWRPNVPSKCAQVLYFSVSFYFLHCANKYLTHHLKEF